MWSAKVQPNDSGTLLSTHHSVHKATLSAAIKDKKAAPDPGPTK